MKEEYCRYNQHEILTDDIPEDYTFCYLGKEFFQDLFSENSTLIENNIIHIEKNRLYLKNMSSNKEEHFFCIITDDKYAYIFNTYGGIYKILITKYLIENVNDYISQIINNNVNSFKLLFNVELLYKSFKLNSFELTSYYYNIPKYKNLVHFLERIKEKLIYQEDINNIDFLLINI